MSSPQRPTSPSPNAVHRGDTVAFDEPPTPQPAAAPRGGTLAYGDRPSDVYARTPPARDLATDATIAADVGTTGADATIADDAALSATFAVDATPGASVNVKGNASASPRPPVTVAASAHPAATGRSTVLPRVEGAAPEPRLVVDSRTRYELKKKLGEGGVGEVALAHDNDIDRPVAVKRLHREQIAPASLLRFVQEIRTIGRLEHPNIVPIHDVGLDDDGQYFFVMKYLDGETLESVIDKLVAGDPEYHKTYTFAYRLQVFLGILRAVQYAHSRGVIHRDIKPANVMIGKYGEVVLMDWGLAKKVRDDAPELALPGPADGASGAPKGAGDGAKSERAQLFRTRHGALLGTPAYMSPEQALGKNDAIDERSDVYSLSVLFHELLGLRHYLADRATVPHMLAGVIEQDALPLPAVNNEHQERVPAELGWFVRKGLEKDPAKRYQSVDEMIDALEEIADGRFHVQCAVTAMRRGTQDVNRLIARAPNVVMAVLMLALALMAYGGFRLVRDLLA